MRSKIINYILAVANVLRSYVLLGMNIDKALFMGVSILNIRSVLSTYRNTRILMPWLVLTVYSMIVVPMASSILFPVNFKVPIFCAIAYMTLLSIYNYGDLEKFSKFYIYLVLAACIFFFLQEFAFYTTGIRIPGIIPFLDNVYSAKLNTSTSDFINKLAMSQRSASFFLEPAHFVQFVAPGLVISLFNHNKAKLKYAIIITAAMILSRSGNAMVLMAVIYGSYIFLSTGKKYLKLLVVAAVIGAFYYFAGTEQGIELMERSSELDTNISEVNSGFIRIYRGYYVWGAQDLMHKIIGVGDNVDYTMSQATMFAWMFRGDTDLFFNGIQSVLISYGIIGMFIFIIALLTIFRNNTTEGRVLIIMFLALSFVESVYNSSEMVLYIGLSLLYAKSQLSTTFTSVK